MVSCHREENIDFPEQFAEALSRAERPGRGPRPAGDRVHPPAHPEEDGGRGRGGAIRSSLQKPLGLCDYVELQMHAKATLSDSGTITEESSILNFPALNIREAHERPEGMEEAAVMMTGLNWERIQRGADDPGEPAAGRRAASADGARL